jgi:hypothetical protein
LLLVQVYCSSKCLLAFLFVVWNYSLVIAEILLEEMKQVVSRGHTRYVEHPSQISLIVYNNNLHFCILRPLTEISFIEDGEDRTLLVSSAHGNSICDDTTSIFYL